MLDKINLAMKWDGEAGASGNIWHKCLPQLFHYRKGSDLLTTLPQRGSVMTRTTSSPLRYVLFSNTSHRPWPYLSTYIVSISGSVQYHTSSSWKDMSRLDATFRRLTSRWLEPLTLSGIFLVTLQCAGPTFPSVPNVTCVTLIPSSWQPRCRALYTSLMDNQFSTSGGAITESNDITGEPSSKNNSNIISASNSGDFFHAAQNFSISGSQFTEVHGNYVCNNCCLQVGVKISITSWQSLANQQLLCSFYYWCCTTTFATSKAFKHYVLRSWCIPKTAKGLFLL